MHFTEAHVSDLLNEWPRLRRRPVRKQGRAVVAGVIRFEVTPAGKPSITDEYRVRLEFALAPTSDLPRAFEEDRRIARDADHHVNPDGDMCLGSPLRILQVLGPQPTLQRFVAQCIVPFLYAASWRERGLPGYPFDELAHGAPGMVADYERMFGLAGRDCVLNALDLLTMRKRVANKKPCPCRCGARLASCVIGQRLAPFRALASRGFYAAQSASLAAELPSTSALKRQRTPLKSGVRFARAIPLLAQGPRNQLSV